jgi:hypothetical protein
MTDHDPIYEIFIFSKNNKIIIMKFIASTASSVLKSYFEDISIRNYDIIRKRHEMKPPKIHFTFYLFTKIIVFYYLNLLFILLF